MFLLFAGRYHRKSKEGNGGLRFRRARHSRFQQRIGFQKVKSENVIKTDPQSLTLTHRVYGIIPLRRTCERNNVEYLLVGDADNVWYFPEVEPEEGENEKRAAFRAVGERKLVWLIKSIVY
jgi:hypothetical protein